MRKGFEESMQENNYNIRTKTSSRVKNNNKNRDSNIKMNEQSEQYKKSNTVKQKISLFVWLSIFIFVCYQIYLMTSYTLGNISKDDVLMYKIVDKVVTIVLPKYIETTEESTLKIAALGDIYASSSVISASKNGNNYDFESSYDHTKEFLKKYDTVIASLNTPIAGSKLGYSNKTIYNSPDELLKTIKSIGISVLATSNNHILDKNTEGVNKTIAAISENDLFQVGINESGERKNPYIIDKNNIKIGILSYMLESNVKLANTNRKYINELTDENIDKDMRYLKENNVDYVIAYLSMPNEDSSRVTSDQKNSADKLFSKGVNVVLGTGSKVIQYASEDLFDLEDGTKNHTYVIYSLGDFTGELNNDNRKMSIAADITFTKSITKDGKGNILESKTKKNMQINPPISFYTKVDKKYSAINYPIEYTLEKYNDNKINLDDTTYKKILNVREEIKSIIAK